MEADWDLHAIVRSYAAIKTKPSSSATAVTNSSTTTIAGQGVSDPYPLSVIPSPVLTSAVGTLFARPSFADGPKIGKGSEGNLNSGLINDLYGARNKDTQVLLESVRSNVQALVPQINTKTSTAHLSSSYVPAPVPGQKGQHNPAPQKQVWFQINANTSTAPSLSSLSVPAGVIGQQQGQQDGVIGQQQRLQIQQNPAPTNQVLFQMNTHASTAPSLSSSYVPAGMIGRQQGQQTGVIGQQCQQNPAPTNQVLFQINTNTSTAPSLYSSNAPAGVIIGQQQGHQTGMSGPQQGQQIQQNPAPPNQVPFQINTNTSTAPSLYSSSVAAGMIGQQQRQQNGVIGQQQGQQIQQNPAPPNQAPFQIYNNTSTVPTLSSSSVPAPVTAGMTGQQQGQQIGVIGQQQGQQIQQNHAPPKQVLFQQLLGGQQGIQQFSHDQQNQAIEQQSQTNQLQYHQQLLEKNSPQQNQLQFEQQPRQQLQQSPPLFGNINNYLNRTKNSAVDAATADALTVPSLRPKKKAIAPGGSSSASPAPRTRKRRNLTKQVRHVSAEGLCTDIWAWRKYGQKPIKGSPHPRSYYRCSTMKNCPARKHQERSKSDSDMFILTYTGEHTHTAPIHRNSLSGSTRRRLTIPSMTLPMVHRQNSCTTTTPSIGSSSGSTIAASQQLSCPTPGTNDSTISRRTMAAKDPDQNLLLRDEDVNDVTPGTNNMTVSPGTMAAKDTEQNLLLKDDADNNTPGTDYIVSPKTMTTAEVEELLLEDENDNNGVIVHVPDMVSTDDFIRGLDTFAQLATAWDSFPPLNLDQVNSASAGGC